MWIAIVFYGKTIVPPGLASQYLFKRDKQSVKEGKVVPKQVKEEIKPKMCACNQSFDLVMTCYNKLHICNFKMPKEFTSAKSHQVKPMILGR